MVAVVAPTDLPAVTASIDSTDHEFSAEMRLTLIELNEQLEPKVIPLEKIEALRSIAKRIQACDGFIDGETAMAQAVPRREFDALAKSLADAGYSLMCVRPFEKDEQAFVAGIWEHSDNETKLQWSLAPEEARRLNDELQEDGWFPQDFAWTHPHASESLLDGNTSDSERRLTMLWQKAKDGVVRRRKVAIDISLSELLEMERELRGRWGAERLAVQNFVGSDARCCVIWRPLKGQDGNIDIRMRPAFGDLQPGDLRNDLRFTWLDPSVDDRTLLELQDAEFERRAVATAGTESDDHQRRVASFLSSAGDFDAAHELFEALRERNSDDLGWRTSHALLCARSGDLSELEKDIKWFGDKDMQTTLRYFSLCAAVLRDDARAVKQALMGIREASIKSDMRFVVYVRALALVAGSQIDDIAAEADAELFTAAQDLVQNRRYNDPPLLFSSVDFDAARGGAEFQTFLRVGFCNGVGPDRGSVPIKRNTSRACLSVDAFFPRLTEM